MRNKSLLFHGTYYHTYVFPSAHIIAVTLIPGFAMFNHRFITYLSGLMDLMISRLSDDSSYFRPYNYYTYEHNPVYIVVVWFCCLSNLVSNHQDEKTARHPISKTIKDGYTCYTEDKMATRPSDCKNSFRIRISFSRYDHAPDV